MKSFSIAATALALVLAAAPRATANAFVLYGDQDGFGVGATTSTSPELDNATLSDAPGTDIRLVGAGFAGPAFSPVWTLSFAPHSVVTSVVMTMSMAAFGGNVDSLDGPNAIVLDGLGVSSAFLDGFGQTPDGGPSNIVTRSFVLPTAFHALFADGLISLDGTHISESFGQGSFQVDYLRFDITGREVPSVPEPTSMLLLASGVAGLVLRRRRV